MIKMFKIFTTLAVALAASAGAAGEAEKSFDHNGVTYVYTQKTLDDGATLLTGSSHAGDRFRLVVRNGRVTGHANHQPVSYSVASARGATRVTSAVARVAAAE